MKRRHALRFENGVRRGETVALEGGEDDPALVLGRRPGCAIQVVDPSVSGRHAEFVLDADGVLVRDLGSTNGTKVGEERISEMRLAHGDVLHFGNVRASFVDALVDASGGGAEPTGSVPAHAPTRREPPAPTRREPPARAPAAAPAGRSRSAAPAAQAEDAGESVGRVSADALARTRERLSPLTLLVLAALLGLLVAARSFLGSGGGEGRETTGRPVVAVPGDLVDDASFEGDDLDGFEASPAAPAAFGLDGSAARTGVGGLSASLAAGEWAELASAAVRVPRGGGLALSAWARCEGGGAGVAARAGVRFEAADGGARPFTVWTAPVAAGSERAAGSDASEGGDFTPLELRAALPPGYDLARAVVRGRGPAGPTPPQDADGEEDPGPVGRVEFDDLSLVASADAGGAGGLARFGEYELSLQAGAGALFKIDRVLVSGLEIAASGGRGVDRAPLDQEARETGFALHARGAGRLALVAEPALAAGGVATVGGAGQGIGYRLHQVEFEREDVASLLLGRGRDQVRVVLPAATRVSGRPSDGAFLLQADLAGPGEVFLQLDFKDERNRAQVLAREAREAERGGEPGRAVALHERILNELPFGEELIAEASGARGRLVSAGLVELRNLDRRVERAGFFRLVDDYRACLADARALAARYAGTEVARGADELAAGVEGELAVLERDLERNERGRLEAIAATLRASESPELAARVERYLDEHFAGGDAGGAPGEDGEAGRDSGGQGG